MIEQFTVRDPEDEIQKSDSIQDIAGLRIEDGSLNGQGHVAPSLHDSQSIPSGRLMIEDGSSEKPLRSNSGRLY